MATKHDKSVDTWGRVVQLTALVILGILLFIKATSKLELSSWEVVLYGGILGIAWRANPNFLRRFQ